MRKTLTLLLIIALLLIAALPLVACDDDDIYSGRGHDYAPSDPCYGWCETRPQDAPPWCNCQ